MSLGDVTRWKATAHEALCYVMSVTKRVRTPSVTPLSVAFLVLLSSYKCLARTEIRTMGVYHQFKTDRLLFRILL